MQPRHPFGAIACGYIFVGMLVGFGIGLSLGKLNHQWLTQLHDLGSFDSMFIMLLIWTAVALNAFLHYRSKKLLIQINPDTAQIPKNEAV